MISSQQFDFDQVCKRVCHFELLSRFCSEPFSVTKARLCRSHTIRTRTPLPLMELSISECSLLLWLLPERDSLLICGLLVCLTMCFYSLFSSTATNPVQSAATMNLPEPISINSVDSTQEQPIDDDYEVINDSDRDDSTSDVSKNKARVIYSRVSCEWSSFHWSSQDHA